MNVENEKWGIDLLGRTMWYEPWPTDIQGVYRQPNEDEIDRTYSISGEAVKETLLYFEECKGNTEKLVHLLNEHVIGDRFIIDRESLLDNDRWYTHEYYFYFNIFTKRVMNDYNWHFSKGENVQLSKYHQIYEAGFLKYIPYGENEGDATNSIFYSAIKHYSSAGYDFSDFFTWTDTLTCHKTNINYKNDVSKLDNYWLCGEFVAYLNEFLIIILNKNNMMEMANDCFDLYFLEGFSYIPESMLIKMIPYFTKKSTNYYDIELSYKKNNSIDFVVKDVKGRINQVGIYQASAYQAAHLLTIAAYQQFINKLLKLDELPIVKDIVGIYSFSCSFTLQWKKRILSIPYLPLLITNLCAITLLWLNQLFQLDLTLYILVFFLPMNIIIILMRKLKIDLQRRNILKSHIEKNIEDNIKRLEKAEDLSRELMLEKNILEQKVRDRTSKLAEANEKLKELDKAKTDFFANISHELRTPLTLMLGPVESIMTGGYGDTLSKDDHVFAMLQFNGSKLLRLINNLLDFTKIEADKMTIRKKKTDITGLVRFYTSMIKPYVESKGLSVAFNNNCFRDSNAGGKTIAWIDRDLFEKAIFNLLSNAVKFTPDGGCIILQLDRDADSFSISIKDSGIGIPEEKLETIFERFTQIDGSSSRKYEGTGIGLSLTKEIIKIMGGTLTVASKLGEGSVFTIRLPLGQGEEAGGEEAIEDPRIMTTYFTTEFEQNIKRRTQEVPAGKADLEKNQKQKKILIVEDSSDMQVFLRTLLGNEYSLFVASNGEEGLLRAEQDRPDLILADVMMPGMDGYEMTRILKSRIDLRGIPVLLLTAKADPHMKLAGFEKGADDYIIKPFNALDLKARIKAHLRMKALRDRIVRQRDRLKKQQQRLKSVIKQKDTAWKLLEEREKRFHEMAEYLPAAIVEIDNELKITYLNKIGHELLDLTSAESSWKPSLADFIDPADKERFIRDVGTTAISHISGLYEYRFVSRHNNTFFGLFKSTALYYENRSIGKRAIITEVRHYLDLVLMPEDHFYDKYHISPREKDVFVHLLKGYKNRDIGEKLFISERTVKKHIASILEKTDSTRRRDLINLVRESEKNR